MNTANDNIGTWFVIVFVVLGPGILLLGVLALVLRARRRSRWVHTRGEVIDYTNVYAGRTMDASTMHPNLRFRASDGRLIEGRQKVAIDIGWYPTGTIQVWYDPQDPQRFVSSRGWWDSPGLLMVVFGGAVTLIGVVFGLLIG